MSILGFFTVLFLIVCTVILAEMYREQHSFCVTHYEVHSPKITCTAEKDSVNRIIFLSDMHNHVYGKQNNKLFEAIRAEQPDLILIGGDMLVAKNDVRYQEALDFVSRVMSPLIKKIAEKKIKVISNAGGVNPLACRDALQKIIDEKGLDLKVAVVLGDDGLPNHTELQQKNIKEMFNPFNQFYRKFRFTPIKLMSWSTLLLPLLQI